MTLPEKPTVFRRALPTKTYSSGGIKKGGVLPLTRGSKGRSPLPLLAFLRLQDARKCIIGHRIWSKLCCLLTWTPPGFVSVTRAERRAKLAEK